MHSKTLARAVGAALVLTAGAANAYVPSSNTDADIVLYWGGATASTVSAQELTVNALCDTDVHIVYVRTESDTVASRKNLPGNDWAVACRTAPVGQTPRSGLPNDKRVLIVKRDRGGSGVGVGPLQVNTGISFLTINAANCPDVITPGSNGAPTVVGPTGVVPLQGCPNTIPAATLYSTTALAEIGTSDIEPDKFVGINVPVVDGVGLPFLTNVSFGDVQALSALTFNTPVTLPLFQALQRAQFPLTSVCHPDNAGYGTIITVDGINRPDITNGNSEACMPSLTKLEIDSLLTGRVAAWSQLLRADGTSIGITGAVQICRRVEGSGTQATINALISNWPCDPNAADTAFDIIQPRNTASGTLVLNSGSSDVATCLTNFAGSANPHAIGVLSVEGRNNTNSAPYRYIKIDGVAPTLRNIHRGDYWFWAQQSCQRRNYATLNANAPVGADDTTANRTLAFNALCGASSANSLGSFGALLALNNPQNAANCSSGSNLAQCGSLYTWGQSGWLATATTAQVYDNVLAASTRPVNAWTREVAPGRVNICQVPVKASVGGNAARGIVVAPNPNWTP